MIGGKDRDPLAVERTDLAEDRTIQATERTFAGWLRTAFGAIGIGLAFRAVFGDFHPPWLARAVATLFVLLGVAITYTAEQRAFRSFKRLHAHHVEPPDIPNLRWVSRSVIAGALLLVAGFWILNDGNLDG
ncbi:MAG: DUF202 domain-containing protein [Novosphingobium sp.]|nr:DUF202 domain-containing protein [Novosphingobium sp.]